MYTPTYSDLYTNAYLLNIYSDIHILWAFRRAADVPKHDPANRLARLTLGTLGNTSHVDAPPRRET